MQAENLTSSSQAKSTEARVGDRCGQVVADFTIAQPIDEVGITVQGGAITVQGGAIAVQGGAITVQPPPRVVRSPCKGGVITVQIEALLIAVAKIS